MRRAAKHVLGAAFHDASRIVENAELEYRRIASSIPSANRGGRDLLRTAAYAAALDTALRSAGIDRERSAELVSDTVFRSIIRARSAVYGLAGLRRRTPLERARWGADLMRRFYYTSPDWVIEDVDVEDGFGFDVHRCVVSEFLASLGMSDLCETAICAQDERSAATHGVPFVRTETLASGGRRCDFRYRPTEAGSHGSIHGVSHAIAVDAPPEEVWEWLSEMAERYREWHPDHVSAVWTRGEPNRPGSRFEAVEYLGGHKERLAFELTRVEPPTLMEYRILGPHALLLPGGRFLVIRTETGSVFRADIDVRFPRLLGRLLRTRMQSLDRHMEEEGESLKRLVEAAD